MNNMRTNVVETTASCSKLETFGFSPAARFHIQAEEDRIIPEPVAMSVLDTLFGRYSETDFLSELEAEHRQERPTSLALP